MDQLRRTMLEGLCLIPIGVRSLDALALDAMEQRPIPATGERLPVIGLGTYIAFDFPAEQADDMAAAVDTVRGFLDAGARLIDSSPMYGLAEERVGDVLRRLRPDPAPFLATKVWTRGQAAGEEQMEHSLRLLGAGRIDLMQIHNLVDAEIHLKTLQAWRGEGRVRYLGVTHYHAGAYAEVERVLGRHRPDFLQINYSVLEPEAEHRLLPFCRDQGIAVIVNRPFAQGGLFDKAKGRPLPPWVGDLGCSSWAQVFLKWILGHPAVTCVIPATRNPRHLADNLAAGSGPLPDENLRRRIREAVTRG